MRDQPPENPLDGLPLIEATPPRWVEIATSDLDSLLIDHAHCELKAASNAMAIAGRFAERSALVCDMTSLAREELRHFEQVHALVRDRGRTLTRPATDVYVKRLHQLVRRDRDGGAALLDQLILCGFIEARSCERFRLLARAPLEAALRGFYTDLSRAEARHHLLFFEHAALATDQAEAAARVSEVARMEAELIRELPLEARMH
jgi:tRNA-(ms[2]io[6]A)-hydroxylase